MAQVSPSREQSKFMLRFLDGMRDEIKQAAKSSGRSMNSEILHRLQAYGPSIPEDTNTMAKGQSLTIRIDDATKERLDALSKRGPYRISITSIVERGIALAAEELERMDAAK